ncbi:hypothetical protein PGIGA_G00187390 [Pangasianodon gigas]|uniref:Uncharacterized protein n=1 Tax=Pangasianodon gigas TaxID=30993 RepID=A0ACC5WDC0_PANGG|nr:hypothetical protein [Pangasianodon gigas]
MLPVYFSLSLSFCIKGCLNPEGFHFLQPESPKESSRSLRLKRMREREKENNIKKHKKACREDQPRTSAHQPQSVVPECQSQAALMGGLRVCALVCEVACCWRAKAVETPSARLSYRTGPVPVGHLCPGSVGEGLGSSCQDFGGWGAPGTDTRPLSVHLRQAACSQCQCGKPLRPTLCLFHSHSLPI